MRKTRVLQADAQALIAKATAGGPAIAQEGHNFLVFGDALSGNRRDTRLGSLIHDISRLRRTALDQILKPLGVTRAQWWVIAHLSRHDGMVQTQLAESLEVGKASLGALLERLEATGLIERRPDPDDRRAKRVHLTETAVHLLGRLQAAEAAFNIRMLQGIGDKDRRELVRLLSLIKGTLVASHLDATVDGV